MKKLIILLSFVLSGCMWQAVSSNDIETAEKICANRGAKVVEITASFIGDESVLCSDRKVRNLWPER